MGERMLGDRKQGQETKENKKIMRTEENKKGILRRRESYNNAEKKGELTKTKKNFST